MGDSQRVFQSSFFIGEFSDITNSKDMITRVHLTEREIEIIEAMSQGFSSDEISARFFISTLTVKTHRRNAMEKLKARNAAHMVRICFEENLLKKVIEI